MGGERRTSDLPSCCNGDMAASDEQSGSDPREGSSLWERQRSAASRNREAIVRAARKLFEERAIEEVEVRDIARAAGVGVGTVYRRFGDKGSLVAALLDGPERELQNALLAGPPPLGPGAPSAKRLAAFLVALAQLTENNLDLLFASEASCAGGRYRIGSYAAWRLHVTVLLRDIQPRIDHEWHADLLLAPLGAELYRHQRRELGMSAQRIVDNLVATVDVLTAKGDR